jgi:hypothetical protein
MVPSCRQNAGKSYNIKEYHKAFENVGDFVWERHGKMNYVLIKYLRAR